MVGRMREHEETLVGTRVSALAVAMNKRREVGPGSRFATGGSPRLFNHGSPGWSGEQESDGRKTHYGQNTKRNRDY